MAHPLVIHCKRDTARVNRPDYVYVGRPSKWGNPFPLRPGASQVDREECLRKYKEYFYNSQLERDAVQELKGKTLGCWCAPKMCHADILALVANQEYGSIEQGPE